MSVVAVMKIADAQAQPEHSSRGRSYRAECRRGPYRYAHSAQTVHHQVLLRTCRANRASNCVPTIMPMPIRVFNTPNTADVERCLGHTKYDLAV
jgi:hypothetical protein